MEATKAPMNEFSIVAGVASILGLLFSLGALIQAGRASAAAKEARDHIVIRTLADEFEHACIRLEQLLDFIEHDRLAEAAIRANELVSALSEIPYRRSPYLSENHRNELLNARTQVQIVGQVLSTNRNQPLSVERKQRLVQACQRGAMTLRENLGTIKGQLDSGAKQ